MLLGKHAVPLTQSLASLRLSRIYHFSNDDLEELRKLRVLLEREEVILYLPQQVVEEFWRNREGKIFDALDLLHK